MQSMHIRQILKSKCSFKYVWLNISEARNTSILCLEEIHIVISLCLQWTQANSLTYRKKLTQNRFSHAKCTVSWFLRISLHGCGSKWRRLSHSCLFPLDMWRLLNTTPLWSQRLHTECCVWAERAPSRVTATCFQSTRPLTFLKSGTVTVSKRASDMRTREVCGVSECWRVCMCVFVGACGVGGSVWQHMHLLCIRNRHTHVRIASLRKHNTKAEREVHPLCHSESDWLVISSIFLSSL